MRKILSAILSGVAAPLLLSLAFAVCLAATETKAPEVTNPRFKEVLAKEQTEIANLLQRALDEEVPAATRVEAINVLNESYYDYLLANAAPLIAEKDAHVSLATVRALGGQIAMLPSNHGHHKEPPNEQEEYQAYVVKTTLAMLRAALDASNDARNEAAAILASRGDTAGLDLIQALMDQGRMDTVKGLGYISLAPSPIASSYSEKYSLSPNPQVQSAAISQLAYDPSYTDKIRDLALDKDTPKEVMASAIPGLAATDKEFLSYGPKLAEDPTLDDTVRAQAVTYSAKFAIENETPKGEVFEFVPALSKAAGELGSKDALDAVMDLKANYDIR